MLFLTNSNVSFLQFHLMHFIEYQWKRAKKCKCIDTFVFSFSQTTLVLYLVLLKSRPFKFLPYNCITIWQNFNHLHFVNQSQNNRPVERSKLWCHLLKVRRTIARLYASATEGILTPYLSALDFWNLLFTKLILNLIICLF